MGVCVCVCVGGGVVAIQKTMKMCVWHCYSFRISTDTYNIAPYRAVSYFTVSYFTWE